MAVLLAPSILAADFSNLEQVARFINESGADSVHVDVMDGNFVPNIAIGTPVFKAICRHCSKIIDTHLMVSNPQRYATIFANLGADIITVHYEVCHNNLAQIIRQVKALGKKVGVALNPSTSVANLKPVIKKIDMICLMGVYPGFAGQFMVEGIDKKINQLKNMLLVTNSLAKIQVDGGVTLNNAKKLVDAGADVLVSGSEVFNAKNPEEVIMKLKQLV